MSPALRDLEAALLSGKIAHGNHPVLTMCAANAVVQRDPAGNRKLNKAKSRGRIDGMVTLAMFMGAAGSHVPNDPGPSVYETRGLLVV
jgi:phage terminase large subunit-like protein